MTHLRDLLAAANMQNSPRTRLGLSMIGLGLLANEFVLAATLSADGVISDPGLIWTIRLAQMGIVLLGAAVLKYRVWLVAAGTGLALFVVLEAGARAVGVPPLSDLWNVDYPIRIEPGGRLFRQHSTVGYGLIPGSFDITLPSGFEYTVTHVDSVLGTSHALRVTHAPEESTGQARKPQIWIMGGSYTYGWALDDEETFPWLVQLRIPEYEVVNFGVGGYGTVHSYLQFTEALELGNVPRYVVVAYASFHEERNTMSRRHRKTLLPLPRGTFGRFNQPSARLNRTGELEFRFGSVALRQFPGMWTFSFIHFIEAVVYNPIEHRMLKSQDVSLALLQQLARVAGEHGAEVIVATIDQWDDRAAQMRARLRESGIRTVDISIDLRIPENNSRPHDSHPSAVANRQYASALADYLIESVLR